MELKRREREAKAKVEKLVQGRRLFCAVVVTHDALCTIYRAVYMRGRSKVCARRLRAPQFPTDVERQQKQFQLLQKENAELVAVSDKLPVELEQLQAELESEKEAYENARSAVEQAEYARERKKKHLREGHELYESRLALKIQTSKKDGATISVFIGSLVPGGCFCAHFRSSLIHLIEWAGSIVIKMHKIDPSNPSRQFYFSILVVNDKYTGTFLKLQSSCPAAWNHLSELCQ